MAMSDDGANVRSMGPRNYPNPPWKHNFWEGPEYPGKTHDFRQSVDLRPKQTGRDFSIFTNR
jgi:hypothetical protein